MSSTIRSSRMRRDAIGLMNAASVLRKQIKSGTLLLAWLVVRCVDPWATFAADLPSWPPQAPPLPASRGNVVRVATAEELLAAVERARNGDTILLADGQYKLPRVIVLDGKKDFALRSAAGDPGKVTLRGKGWDSGDKGDDLIHVGRCDGVTIADLTFTDCH